jgi:signal transduction histidine kinase/ligand-binding sensor domain-containing protein
LRTPSGPRFSAGAYLHRRSDQWLDYNPAFQRHSAADTLSPGIIADDPVGGPGTNPLVGDITSTSDFCKQMNRSDRRRSAVIAGCMLLVCRADAFALNSGLDVSQYAHASWKVGEGFSEGTIHSIAQTADGFLWLGTEFGLQRFDGVRAVRWEPPPGQRLPSSDIRSLHGGRDGRLWIGTFRGLASWKDRELTRYPELDGQVIEALLEDREGTIWVAGWALSTGSLCKIQSGNIECYGQDGRFGSGVTPLYEDRERNLWVGAMNGLWRWKPGPPTLYPMPDPAQRIYAILESDDGGLLVAQHTGITKLRNGKFETYPLPAGFQPHRLLRDRDGGLWIGALADRGLLHVHNGRTDRFTQAEGLSGRSVNSFFEDREGNIWVATGEGLDRFRDFAIPTFSDQQGLSSGEIFSLLTARDGSLWLGASDGLNRWSKDQITVYRYRGLAGARVGSPISGLAAGREDPKATIREIIASGLPDKPYSLFQDARGQIWVGTQNGIVFLASDRFVPVGSVPNGIVFSFTDDGVGNVWVSHQEALLRLFEARVVERIPWSRLGRALPANALRHDPVQGGLWLGFRDGGVAYFRDGQVRASYAAAEGLGDGEVRGFYVDRNSALWAATFGGLSRIKDGHVVTLTSQNGLPCNTVHWMREDGAGSVWLYLACGLLRIGWSELDAWASHRTQTIHATLFDSADGVSSQRYAGGYDSVVEKSVDGKLWFVRRGGVSVIDPHHLPFNKLPPPVHIEQVTADDKIYDATNGLRLPPRIRNLAIDYTALSFVAPERMRFRYKLEGQNRNWHEVVNDRQVQYTNLAPGTYRFRVMASNNSGVWNEAGDTLTFSIAPAYYQTRWFAAMVALGSATLLWAAYQLRIRQLAHQFNRTLDARVSERTRIARDLHDTLLQSFQGALLRFQSVGTVLATRPEEARRRLERALDQAETAVTEARNAVQDLRASATTVNDLANGIAAIGAELTGDPAAGPVPLIDVEVDGASRDLNPVVREEAFRIAGEALRNAVKHAEARCVIVTIHYEPRQLRLVIRDDGKGIPSDTMARQQVAGHFGLPGMRERAAIVKGRLDVRSAPEAGTDVELRVPAAIAYGRSAGSWWSRVSRRF